MQPKADAKANSECPDCGAAGKNNWKKDDDLPQIGQTYQCQNCGQEAYLYDTTEPPARGQSYVWAPVRSHMRLNLRFFEVVGEWPDSALTELYERGLERTDAVDYHIVEREGLTQSEWAELTKRNQSTISEHVSEAKLQLVDDI